MRRLYDRNFAIAVASQTCFMVAWTMCAHYARWIGFLGGDREQIGRIMGDTMLAGILLRPWIGQWINRLGARTVWGLGYACFVVAVLSNLVLHSLHPSIYLIRGGLVLAAALTYGSSLTYITQNAPPSRRTEAIGTFGMSGFIAMLVGPRFGEFILGVGDREREVFVTLFLTISLVFVPAFVALCFLKPTPPEHRSPNVKLIDFARTASKHWPGSVALVQVLFGLTLTIPFVFLADFVDDLGLSRGSTGSTGSSGAMGRFFLGYAATAMFIRIVFRQLPDRVGRRKVLIGGLLMSMTGALVLVLVANGQLHSLLLPGMLCGAGHGFAFHTMTSLTLERFPLDVRGSGAGLALMLLDAGTLIGGRTLGWVAKYHGYDALFSIIALCALTTAVVFAAFSVPIWVRRARKRRKVTEEP